MTMHRPLQHGTSSQLRLFRPSWIAVLVLLLIALMSTVQVCHTHDLLPGKADSHSSLPHQDAAPDHCPLCVAMHSALPVDIQAAPESVAHIQALDSAAADAQRLFRWRFQLASRPPPASAAA